MIELLRYARLKPYGVVSTKVIDPDTVQVSFKRFSVEIPAKEETPEISEVSFADLYTRLGELQIELEVVKELLELKQGS